MTHTKNPTTSAEMMSSVLPLEKKIVLKCPHFSTYKLINPRLCMKMLVCTRQCICMHEAAGYNPPVQNKYLHSPPPVLRHCSGGGAIKFNN